MIMLTKEQLDQLISDVWDRGFGWGALGGLDFRHTRACCTFRQIDLQEFGERHSNGQPAVNMVLPTPEQVMHVVMKFQWEDRKNGTGTTNWAANLGMTVVEYVARLNADHGREVK